MVLTPALRSTMNGPIFDIGRFLPRRSDAVSTQKKNRNFTMIAKSEPIPNDMNKAAMMSDCLDFMDNNSQASVNGRLGGSSEQRGQ